MTEAMKHRLVGAAVLVALGVIAWPVLFDTTPVREMSQRSQIPTEPALELRQGDEMGRFLLGSTVVMLWPKPAAQALRFNPAWAPARPIRLGEVMADLA